MPIAFSAPEMVTVRPGDTLGKLAARHGVGVEDLRIWNGIEGDIIEVDQVLLVWKSPPRPERVAAAPRPRVTPEAVLGTSGGSPASSPPLPSVGSEVAAPSEAPLAADPLAPEVEEVPPAQRQRIVVERPLLAGLFGMSVGSDVDLAEAASGMQRHDAAPGTSGGVDLGDRRLATGTDTEELAVEKRQMRNLGPAIPDTPVFPPRLSKPPPKRCLSGPSARVSEDGSVSSGGLSTAQINAGMGQISRHTVRCFPSGTEGSYAVIVEITVGCDGTVKNVFLINGGVVPSRVTSCIQKTLGYASFAAHSVPDGVSFEYPMKFSF